MDIVIVSDIFGKTPALEVLAASLDGNVFIIDPYDGINMQFVSESEAYDHFTQHVSLDSYQVLVSSFVNNLSDPVVVIGFSAGASAAWLASASFGQHVVCVYGVYSSQIRHHLWVTPVVPTYLVFPKQEKHFNGNTVMNELKGKPNITLIHTAYLHGFMNKLSVNFNQQGYDCLKRLINHHLAEISSL
jgi:dienelactone hydrolase